MTSPTQPATSTPPHPRADDAELDAGKARCLDDTGEVLPRLERGDRQDVRPHGRGPVRREERVDPVGDDVDPLAWNACGSATSAS